MGIDIRYRFHHGKAVGHVIVFLDDIFQGQKDFFRGGLRGIQKLTFQDTCGIGV